MHMKTLKVSSTSFDVTYNSFAEAVAATNREPRHYLAQKTKNQLLGDVVTKFSLGEGWLYLTFASKRVLRVFVDRGPVLWELLSGCAEVDSDSVRPNARRLFPIPGCECRQWRELKERKFGFQSSDRRNLPGEARRRIRGNWF